MTHTARDLPEPPYFAVIFLAELTDNDLGQYREDGDALLELARQQPGFLGYDDLCIKGNYSFNVSYWKTESDITAWRDNFEHSVARASGRENWYRWYEIRVAKVERAYSFSNAAHFAVEPTLNRSL